MLTLTTNEYPEGLKEIPDPPEKLYLKGKLPPEGISYLAVVGSRNYTSYGKQITEKIIAELSRRQQSSGQASSNIAIVSGLALGIDAIAHKASLEAHLPTVAIPGSGLNRDVLYPQTHRGLAEQILKNDGALISEFEPDFRATPYAFPQRNRLMAGISRGVLIIEAAERSGTLITARLALEYNRDVFVVPASIFSRNSEGSNRLLKEGAVPICSGEDILEHWGIAKETEGKAQDIKALEHCSEEEKKILEILREPISKDELIRRLEMQTQEASVLLSAMEIKGLIKETLGEIRSNI